MGDRKGYKKTKLGWIPDEWDVKEVSEIAEILVSNVDKKTKNDEREVLLCNYMDVYNNEYINSSISYMKATANKNEINKFTLQKDDVLITKDSETRDDIANSSVIIDNLKNILCGYHLAILRPNIKKISGIFLMKAIRSPEVHKYFVKLANGITRFGLTNPAINKAIIPLPPLPEQKKIASILTTVDDKIESINKQIEQTEQLKKGLSQELLTKGIGHTEFKDSKVGRIPEAWDVFNFTESYKTVSAKKYQVVKSQYKKNGKIPIIDQGQKFIVAYIDDSKKIFNVGNGVIVFGDHTRIIKFINFDFVIGADGTQLLKPQKLFDIKYSYYQLLNKRIQNLGYSRHFKLVKEMYFLCPPLPEQKQIAAILSAVDDKIEILRSKKSKHETLKKGLMEQLLTGQIRVQV